MALFKLQKGYRFYKSNKQFQILREIETGWQIENTSSGILEVISKDQLYQEYADGKISFEMESDYIPKIKTESGWIDATFKSLDLDVQELLKHKKLIIDQHISKHGENFSHKLVEMTLSEYWKSDTSLRPCTRTFINWANRYLNSDKNILSLLPQDSKKGNRHNRINQAVVDFCEKAIRDVYMTQKRETITETLNYAIALIARENQFRPDEHKLILPSINFIRELINRIPKVEVSLARYGKELTRNKFRESIGTAENHAPLYRAEVDHTLLDVIVVDDSTGYVVGRPWLTLIIDCQSKCILGFHLTFDPPSHSSVAKALKHAILPKVDFKKTYTEINGDYEVFGVMHTLVCDNGFEFHSSSLEAVCFELGIVLSYTPRKTPWWKGSVERALGTLNRGVTGLMPGKTFNSVDQKSGYDPTKNACITLKTLNLCINKWIVDFYHNRAHKTLGMSPIAYWKTHVDHSQVSLPTDPMRLDSILGQVTKRSISHYGIELNTIVYNNRELMDLRRELGTKLQVEVRWNSDELGWIYVFPPGGGTLKVDANDAYKKYATGLTLYLHQIIRNYYAKQHEGDAETPEVLAKALEDIRQIVIKEPKKANVKSGVKRQRLEKSLTAKPELNQEILHPKVIATAAKESTLLKATDSAKQTTISTIKPIITHRKSY